MGNSFLKGWFRPQAPAHGQHLLGSQAPRGKLFDRTEGDAVGLAEGAIDGAGFGHAHLGMVEDERRNIAGMGITVTDEAATFGCFEDGGLEHPKVFLLAA